MGRLHALPAVDLDGGIPDTTTPPPQAALRVLKELGPGGLDLATWWGATSPSQRLIILQVGCRHSVVHSRTRCKYLRCAFGPGSRPDSRNTRDPTSPLMIAREWQMARELLKATVGQSADAIDVLCPELSDSKLERLVPAVPALIRARLEDSARRATRCV